MTTFSRPEHPAPRRRALVILLAAGVCGAALTVGAADGRIVGSGTVRTEARAIGSFRAVTVRGGLTLKLRQAGREAVEVRADDNVLPLIETRIVDRAGVPTLEIGTRPGANFTTRDDPVVSVDVATLNALTASGSGDVRGEALKSAGLTIVQSGSGDMTFDRLAVDELALRIAGSGDVELGGRAPRLRLAIAGSGDVDAAKLEADDVDVSIAGSGDAELQAQKTLTVSIAGSGDVVYAGAATVKSTVAGSGSVTRR